MISGPTLSLFTEIIDEANKLVNTYVHPGDLTGQVNYIGIFSQSMSEYTALVKILKKCGIVFEKQPTGNYFKLTKPIRTATGEITVARVRRPDPEITEKGYLDFETADYTAFKNKYLSHSNFRVINNILGKELIALRDPDFNVRVYFPEKF